MESFCVHRKAPKQSDGVEIWLVKQTFVFGDDFQYRVFLQSNNQIFTKPTPTRLSLIHI